MPKLIQKEEEEERTVDDVATELGEVYFIQKDANTEQGKLRSEFFEAATVENQAQELAQKTWPTWADDEESAKARALLYNPGWRVLGVLQVTAKEYKVLLQEDPDWLKYETVVFNAEADEGYVVTKTIRSGSTMIDTEQIKKEEPSLWEAITTYPNYDLIADLLYHANMEPDEIDERIDDAMRAAGVERVLSDPSTWTEEITESVKPYVYEAAKTKALNVRKAKDDELADL